MKRGTALIWTLVALVALGVALVGATTTFLEVSRLQRRSRQRLIALECGQRELERVRSGAPSSSSHPVAGLPEGRAQVSVTTDANPALRRVHVEVRWRDPDGERRMQWETLVTR
jgi:Tfp pilus assembly protein PilV